MAPPRRVALIAAVTLGGPLTEGVKLQAEADDVPTLLAVTGYWKLDPMGDTGRLRHGSGNYVRQMPIVMTLNTPMAIYGDEYGIEHMTQAHEGAVAGPLIGIHSHSLNSSEPCKSHGAQLRANVTHWTHPVDAPSVSLGCIWDGKVGILSRAMEEHPAYDLYAWVDIGMHADKRYMDTFKGHNQEPWPHPRKLALIPKDKVTISHSGINCDRYSDQPFKFWHCAAATTFVVPKAVLPWFHREFYKTLNECIQFWSDGHTSPNEKGDVFGGYGCLSEQMIMSIIARDSPNMFNWIGHGWGAAAANLTTDKITFSEAAMASNTTSDLFDWLSADSNHEVKRV